MADRYRPEVMARTPAERELSRLGIPKTYWDIKLKEMTFRITPFRNTSLSPVSQRHWCESLVLDPPYAPLIVVASGPTGSGATALAVWFLRLRSHLKRPKGFVNLATPPGYGVRNYSTLIAHNVTNTATPARCEVTRDILTTYADNFRVLVLTGSKTPETWALNKLYLRPSAVFFMKDL